MKCPKCNLTDKTMTVEMARLLYTTNAASRGETRGFSVSNSTIALSLGASRGKTFTETEIVKLLPEKPDSVEIGKYILGSLGISLLVIMVFCGMLRIRPDGITLIFMLFFTIAGAVVGFPLTKLLFQKDFIKNAKKEEEYDSSWICLRDGYCWINR